MIKNYFKVAFRNLYRNKGFSVINISGLAVGMASAILILLWIQNEISYDRFFKNTDRIYMMYNRDKFDGELQTWNSTPTPMAAALKRDYPEVEDAVRFRNVTFLTSVGDKHLNVRGAFADSGFLSVFSFPLLKGNHTKCLANNYNIVLTEKLAKKLFGNEDPMGKTVRIDTAENFTITGILKDLPNNTQLNFEYLLPWAFITKLGWDQQMWGRNSVNTYTLLKPGTSQAAFDAKVKNITINHITEGQKSTTEVFTQPLSKLYLYSKSENGKLVDGRIQIVRLFAIIAVFILLIACINFMNLSTARSEKRAKEVGIRKVVGSRKGSLVIQFIGESVMLAMIAGILAVIIVQVSLQGFNQLIGTVLSIDFGNPLYWFFIVTFIVFTGIVAGSYPAFYLSSYKPVKVLKGTFKAAHALVTPRKVLVVLQFSFAIILIICTVIVKHQIQYAQERNSGYDKNNLVYTFNQGDINKHYDLIKHDLLNSGAVIAVTKSSSPITQNWSEGWGYSWLGSSEADKKMNFVTLGSDADFVKTMGAKLLEGRDIDINNYPTDTTALLLNETAVKAMRLKNPVGQIIKDDDGIFEWHVVGVVKNLILESPYEKINPMMIQGPLRWFQVIHFKLNPAHSTVANLSKAEKIFKKYNPQYPFEYVFADESYAKKFDEEQRTGKLSALFAGLTIFISCLGLFGLATYMAENRIKEIGVRKVLGASVASITTLLSKDFLKLVIISFIIASPVAWWAMSKWLQTYSYRISIEWWVFAGTGLLCLLIAIATVSYQAIKAAVANPVKSLRTE
jgi:putative ABC transport system permease protein